MGNLFGGTPQNCSLEGTPETELSDLEDLTVVKKNTQMSTVFT